MNECRLEYHEWDAQNARPAAPRGRGSRRAAPDRPDGTATAATTAATAAAAARSRHGRAGRVVARIRDRKRAVCQNQLSTWTPYDTPLVLLLNTGPELLAAFTDAVAASFHLP